MSVVQEANRDFVSKGSDAGHMGGVRRKWLVKFLECAGKSM